MSEPSVKSTSTFQDVDDSNFWTRTVHGKNYVVHKSEFLPDSIGFTHLQAKKDVALLDREIGLLKSLSSYVKNFVNMGADFGGYVPLALRNNFQNVYVTNIDYTVKINISNHDTDKVIQEGMQNFNYSEPSILRIEPKYLNGTTSQIGGPQLACLKFILCNSNFLALGYRMINIKNGRVLYVHESIWDKFKIDFASYIEETEQGFFLTYDNLINLLIMVKNAGPEFRDMLTRNLPVFDRWTILDTGSTDETLQIINDVLISKKIPGDLYQEPFVNFGFSRNRLLELAGTSCAFNLMLDDTYIVEHPKELRKFLTLVRSDDVAESYSIYITDDQTTYVSNRISKPENKIRYKYRIHEILENNISMLIPANISYISENSEDRYMRDRSLKRKEQDLIWLFEEIEDNPSDPRHYYYVAETYLYRKEYDKAYEFYEKRSKFLSGEQEEIQDSLYKMGALGKYYLNFPWEKCQQHLLDCYVFDPTRSESLFVLGKHYLEQQSMGSSELAYLYLKKAFDLGIPDRRMNLRHDIYNAHIPYNLIQLLYNRNEYETARKCCDKILQYKLSIKNRPVPEVSYSRVENWVSLLDIAISNAKFPLTRCRVKNTCSKGDICFIIGGGWSEWDGETLETRGLGGSETFVVRYAETLAGMGYNVTVLCKCLNNKVYKGVLYYCLQSACKYVTENNIDVCFVNRYPELMLLTTTREIPTYFIFHDICKQDEVLPLSNVYGLLGLTEWHENLIKSTFSGNKNIVSTVSYGISPNDWRTEVNKWDISSKGPYEFIYSSFPNRGLLPLLKMWPKIIERYPGSVLNLFCDLKNSWVLEHYKTMIQEIAVLLQENMPGVTNHGWVSGNILRQYWLRSHVWLYPCIFNETCCLTAYEAAASKTLVVCPPLAALKDSVQYGVVVEGDANSTDWQNKAFESLVETLDCEDKRRTLIENNYNWILTKAYDRVVPEFVEKYVIKFTENGNTSNMP